MSDKILIRGLKIYAWHGVNPEEKENGQNFIFDVDIFSDLKKAGLSDELTDTVNYAAVVKLIRRVFTAEKNNLLECAAQRVSDAILEEFSAVDTVRILLKKPEAPISADFDFVGVEIERTREKKKS